MRVCQHVSCQGIAAMAFWFGGCAHVRQGRSQWDVVGAASKGPLVLPGTCAYCSCYLLRAGQPRIAPRQIIPYARGDFRIVLERVLRGGSWGR